MPNTLASIFDYQRPITISRTAEGEVYIADGVNKAQRWNGTDAATENAGMPQAVSSTTHSGSGTGIITGLYSVGVRYIDDDGIPGDLSPLTTFTAASDGLVVYSSIPTSTEPRVAGRQIWRTTADQALTFYLDVQIDNNTSTTASSTRTDTNVSAGLIYQTSMPILNFDGTLNARRFGIPPNFKTVVVSHQERTFWGVDSVVSEGHAEMVSGAVTCTIYGATVTSQFAGRQLHIAEHNQVYTVSTTSNVNNQLVLTEAFSGSTNSFAEYSVRPVSSERNLIYFSELGEPESVPNINAVTLRQDEGDGSELTSMMPMGAFLWLMTPIRTYRWTYQINPIRDGNIYLTTHRGCLNQRCWVQVEGSAYILDRQGAYIFNGGTVQPISGQIQDLFRPGGGIVWDNAKWFHVDYYFSEETVKFFVCLDGSRYPRHALCFHYRQNRWWIEEYPWMLCSSTVTPVNARERLLAGTTMNRVMLTSEEYFDGPRLELSSRGNVSAATMTSVTIAAPTLTASDVANVPIQIVKGRGKGQQRIILTANPTTGRLELDRPWSILPDETSDFQIGGIQWNAKTKWFRLSDTETENDRTYRLAFTPSKNAASMDLRRYLDHSKTPVNNEADYDNLHGTVAVKDSPDVEVDMMVAAEGWTWASFTDSHDFRGPASRFMQAEVRGVQNKDSVVVHSLGIDGVR
jgi:hypothetical protein